MDKRSCVRKIRLEVTGSTESDNSRLNPETPFRAVIFGDFSGRENRGIEGTLVNRHIHVIDRDNSDEVLAKVQVELRLPLFGKTTPPIQIQFSQLDDFHPDRLFERLEVFDALKETRLAAKDLSTSEAIEKKKPAIPVTPKDMDTPFEKICMEKTGGLLDQILEQTEGEPSQPGQSLNSSEWETFLRGIVRPHVVPDTGQKEAEMVASVDAAASELMRKILHHTDFQALEAAWRGLYFLVSRLETGEDLKLSILDISKGELAADLLATDDLKSTGIYKLLVETSVKTPGGDPWAVLAGNYAFDYTHEDAELLGRLGRIARAAGGPFIAAAHPHLLRCESLDQTPDPDDWKGIIDKKASRSWTALRKLPEASYLGLALPRFILRLPYGGETEPTEHFDFEEMERTPRHDDYLWGNPCFACIYLLALGFSQYGWNFRPGTIQDIDDLSVHVFKHQGESLIKAPSEVVLTESAAEAILAEGLMPLLSFTNQERIRLARFQSVAYPPARLEGRWT
jgi:type VI secretion system protein ImpC